MTRIVKARPTPIGAIKTNIDLAKAVSDARPDLTWLQCLKIADAITTEWRNNHEPDIRTIWVNVYDRWCSPFNSEYAAINAARDGAIAIAQPVTFEVKRNT